jgi:uncharacterized protein (TIGR03435 family)
MDSAYFTVRATVPAGATRDEVRMMLQNLLAERFQLKLHHESKQVRGYVLTVGTSGASLKASAESPDNQQAPGGPLKFDLDRDGFAILPPGKTNVIAIPGKDGVTRLSARATIDLLCSYLGRLMQQPVVDGTGLAGIYDLRLSFATPRTSPPDPGDADPAPSIVQAVGSQSGLKMESKRVPVDVLVIDRAERMPSQ